jgi:hypothetical protein
MMRRRTVLATFAESVLLCHSPISVHHASCAGPNPCICCVERKSSRPHRLRWHALIGGCLALLYRISLHRKLTRKSPACMVPISMDWPISTSSCFTIYSFARPISFFVAPLATEQISDWKTVQELPYAQRKIKSQIKRWSLYLSQCGACLLDDKQYRGKQPKLHPDFVLWEVFDLLLSYIFHLLDP